ncbi:MAG TPA: DoxX family protein [Polyangiaceae bacterium]|jgi:hypothetical protein|nr:DoxX family protein [Polyangiaceae bacterium]
MNAITKKAPAAARILLGLIFTVFGLNGFLHFIPQPPLPAGPTLDFVMGLLGTGYFFPFLKGTEVLMGLLLLASRFVPLALTILAPIVLNILAFHAFMAPSGVPLAVVVLVLEVYLAWSYRGVFAAVVHARNEVTTSAPSEDASATYAGAASAHR